MLCKLYHSKLLAALAWTQLEVLRFVDFNVMRQEDEGKATGALELVLVLLYLFPPSVKSCESGVGWRGCAKDIALDFPQL